jgi:hypothetical protein
MAAAVRQLQRNASAASATRIRVHVKHLFQTLFRAAELNQSLNHIWPIVIRRLMQWSVEPRFTVGARQVSTLGDKCTQFLLVVCVARTIIQLSVKLSPGSRINNFLAVLAFLLRLFLLLKLLPLELEFLLLDFETHSLHLVFVYESLHLLFMF